MGRNEEAIQCCDEAVGLDSNEIETWNARAISLTIIGRLGEAVSSICRALELDPNHASAWSIRAGIHERLGENGAAVSSYGEFLRLASSGDEEQMDYARRRLERLRLEVGEDSESVKTAKEYLKL